MIRTTIQTILLLSLMSLAGYGLHSWQVNKIEKRHKAEIAKINASCEKSKAITQKVSHDYQNSLTAHRSRLADARRLYDSARITVTATRPARHDGGTGSPEPAGQGHSSIAGADFINLLGEGEGYRLQLIACQAYVTAVEEFNTEVSR